MKPERPSAPTPASWLRFDKKDKPSYNVTVRLNEHYMAKLRYLAERYEDLSMQRILRKMLLPGLDEQTAPKPPKVPLALCPGCLAARSDESH